MPIKPKLKRDISHNIDHMMAALKVSEKSQSHSFLSEVENLYSQWSGFFSLLKDNFAETWELFSRIEHELESWHKTSSCRATQGHWGPMGLNRNGYTFSATLIKGEDPHATKWLSVSFAHLDNFSIGIGDERIFGLERQPTDQLFGLAACRQLKAKAEVENIKELLNNIRSLQVTFSLHHHALGQLKKSFPLDYLKQCKLVTICYGIFVALNQDDLSELQNTMLDSPSLPKMIDFRAGQKILQKF